MKKSVKILSLIAIMLLAIVGKSQAQIMAYDLWINGVQVTTANTNNVLAGTSNNNKVVYNDAQKTLYLNSANLTATTDVVPLGFIATTSPYMAAIVSDIEGLIINLNGDNTITYNNTNGYAAGIYQNKTMTIQGNGKLDLNVTAQLSSFGISGNALF